MLNAFSVSANEIFQFIFVRHFTISACEPSEQDSKNTIHSKSRQKEKKKLASNFRAPGIAASVVLVLVLVLLVAWLVALFVPLL